MANVECAIEAYGAIILSGLVSWVYQQLGPCGGVSKRVKVSNRVIDTSILITGYSRKGFFSVVTATRTGH